MARDLLKSDASIEIIFVSYSIGAVTLKDQGFAVIDLGFSETNQFVSTLIETHRLITRFRPDLIISHEEYAVIPVAKAFEVPVIFMTDWFALGNALQEECLECADHTIFLDDAGLYDEPGVVKGKITYAGPVFRQFKSKSSDREHVRKLMGCSQDCFIVLVIPGAASASAEVNAPVFQLVISAFDRVAEAKKLLIWIAEGQEAEMLRSMSNGRTDVQISAPTEDIDILMAASDLGITKANRITALELWALGVPSISISYGLNPIDDYRVIQIRTNRFLRGRGLRPDLLTQAMESVRRDQLPHAPLPGLRVSRGRDVAVGTILEIMARQTKTKTGWL